MALRVVHHDSHTEPDRPPPLADYADRARRPRPPRRRAARATPRGMPAELLASRRSHRGEKVGDYIMGGGYLTRILAAAVGPTGASTPSSRPSSSPSAPRLRRRAEHRGRPAAPTSWRCAGPSPRRRAREPLDTIITVQNFHDLYIEVMPAGHSRERDRAPLRRAQARRTLVVVDHSAAAGTGSTLSDALHRIDKADRDRGFHHRRLPARGRERSATPAPRDPRTANVFDPRNPRQIDQFTLRFRKPG